MFGGDDDFFDIFPDIDADGDHDMADFLILDGINKEIQREVDEGEAEASSVDDDEDDLEYVDTEDYESPEDYEEADISLDSEENDIFNIETESEDYETRQGFDEAEKIAPERETRDPEPADTKIYRFCKVSLDYPCKPHYYYFCGDLSLKIGDRVVVPFGWENTLREGTVMSVGECMGCTFPCKVDSIKYVRFVHSKEGTL